MDESTEEWRPVIGYEGRYDVSDRGRVRSLLHGSPLLMKLIPSNKGDYLRVQLWKDGRGKTQWVHRLVLEAFIGPRPDGMVTRHLDGHSRDNGRENLMWGTQKQNIADKKTHGTDYRLNLTHCPQGHPYDEANTGYDSGGRRCKTCHCEGERRARAAGKRPDHRGNRPR